MSICSALFAKYNFKLMDRKMVFFRLQVWKMLYAIVTRHIYSVFIISQIESTEVVLIPLLIPIHQYVYCG